MRRSSVRRFSILFFLAYTVVLTWPGLVPFNRVRPLVFGLPFNFFWVALWVVLGLFVFVMLEWVEVRSEAARAAHPPEHNEVGG
jgi:hypothetical protein